MALRAFLGAVAGRRAPIKLQLTGPVTLGIALQAVGVPHERAFAVAGAAVRARARTLVAAAQETAPMAPLVVFVDEPGLTAAMHPGFPLDPNRTIDLVSGVLATLEPHAVTGLHCCGPPTGAWCCRPGPRSCRCPSTPGPRPTPEPSARSSTTGAGSPGARCPPPARSAPPPSGCGSTCPPSGATSPRAGCDPVLLREQALITPACGLAGHGELQADLVLGLTNQLARRLETQTLGMRLTVGA